MSRLSPIGAFFRWWMEELASLLPAGLRGGTAQQSRAQIVIAIDGPNPRVMVEADRKRTLLYDGQTGAEDLVGALSRAVSSFPSLPVGVRVGLEQCFRRERQLPARAEREFEGILALEMERSMPFKPGEVLTGYHVLPTPAVNGQLAVEHLILKTRLIQPLVEQVRSLGRDVDRIDCWADDGQSVRPIDFLHAANRSAPEGRWSVGRVGGAAAAALAVLAIAQIVVKQNDALGEVERLVQSTQLQARAVHQAMDEAASIATDASNLRKLAEARHAATAVIDAVTKLLSDDVWLENLQLDGDSLELNGYALSAAALLPLFERSALFFDARFRDPLRLDAEQNRERFSLRVKVKPRSAADARPVEPAKGQTR